RSKGLMPTTPAERQLWSVWIAYVVACTLVSFEVAALFGKEAPYQGALYPFFCVITEMAFFILGASYWGWSYDIALAFFALSGVLLLDPYWGTLAFGGLWTLALVAVGLRLRKLGKERGDSET